LEKTEIGEVSHEDNPLFAVFDGMGGEQYGEIAAHIAAESFNSLYKTGIAATKELLVDICRQTNAAITSFAKQKLVECVGTTAALIACGTKEIYACNIGDSKVYRYANKNLTQLSKDHVVDIFRDRKPPLSQFLGIPETEFIIEPYVTQKPYKGGDRYLICSDGLTDMVPDDEIKKTLSENPDIKTCVEILLQKALDKGGNDNITIILCSITQPKVSFWQRLFGK
jgi:protein phosphatase